MPDGHIVKKMSVVDTVIDAIIADIISRKYLPGAKLPNEYDLMSELNVSRNSLREAIKIMSTMGIVEIKHGDGTYVCSQIAPTLIDNVIYSIILNVSSVKELIELRQILDDATVRFAIGRILPEEIDNLEENVRNMIIAIQEDDIVRSQELDYQFHMDLILSCKNELFSRVVQGFYKIFKNSIGQTIFLEKADNQAPIYHQNIIKCIKEKDYNNVHAVVDNSLSTWRKQLK